jgi:predicted transcriptional regulator
MYDPCRGHPEKVQRPIIKTKEKEIIVIPVKETIQELSHDETRKQIIDYIQTVGGRVHVSEIAENLNMDIELVTEILDES